MSPQEKNDQTLAHAILTSLDSKTQLTVIETKIDLLYTETRTKADAALELGKQNASDIADLKDSDKWKLRAVLGVILAAVANALIYLLTNI